MTTRIVLLLGFFLNWASAEDGWLIAPNARSQDPVNQRKAGYNACGPACLLDAYQSASKRWHKSLSRYHALDDETERIRLLIRRHGIKASVHIPGRLRWHRNSGVNIADLTAMANEMRKGVFLPKLKYEILYRNEGEPHSKLLQRIHRTFKKSLKEGYPPIVSLRRVARRNLPQSGTKMWMKIQGHFVVIIGFPETLPEDASTIPVAYHDPWTGRELWGNFRIPDQKFWTTSSFRKRGKFEESPTLVADFPFTRIGLKKVKKGEPTALTLASALGAF